MSKNSKIEWTHHTFNPWVGCTKVSPACDHCYAEGWAKRSGMVQWGPQADRRRTSESNWRQPVKWNAEAERLGIRYRVFCASLADVFDNAVPSQWRADLFGLIELTPRLDWLLLTKRIGNVMRLLPVHDWALRRNVWMGITVANQEEADRDIPKLLALPSHKRFLSMEPLLGDVRLGSFLQKSPSAAYSAGRVTNDMPPWTRIGATAIDWVIVGGESGPQARPMHPQWVRSLRDQCSAAGVSFLFKQWGEWAPHHAGAGGDEGGDLRRGHVLYLQGDGREPDGHFRKGDAAVARIGKKAAGRLLDVRTWDEVPA